MSKAEKPTETLAREKPSEGTVQFTHRQPEIQELTSSNH